MTPGERGILVSRKLDLLGLQSLLHHAKLCRTQSQPPSNFQCLFVCRKLCPAVPGSKHGLHRPPHRDCYQESKPSKNHKHDSGGGRKDKKLDYPLLLPARQSELDRVSCSWCMGNSSWPLEALARAAGNLRAPQGASWPSGQSSSCHVKAESTHQSKAPD